MEQNPKPNQSKNWLAFSFGRISRRVNLPAWKWGTVVRTWVQARRRRGILLVSLGLTILVVLGLVGFRFMQPPLVTSLLGQAQAAYDGGRYTESTAVLRQELQANPANNAARLLLAQSLVNLRRWPEASAALNEALKTEPQNAQILYWIGKAQFKAENLAAAESTWRIILSRTDKAAQLVQAQVQVGLGELRFRQGQFEESSQLLYSALANASSLEALDQQKAFYLYGLLLTRDLRLSEGLNSLQKAQKVALPATELDNIPHKAAHQQATEKIRSLLDQLPEVNKQRVEAARRAKLAYSFTLVEEYELAEEQLLQVVKLTPQYADARAYLGLVYWRTGRGDKAFTTFQTALKDAPDSRFIRQLFAEFLLDRLPGQLAGSSDFRATAEQARELIDQLVKENPRDPSLQVLLGRYFMVARSDYQNGAKYYQIAAGFNREKPLAGLNPNALLARYYSESNVNPCVLGVDSGLAATRDLPADAESWFAAGQAYRLCGHAKLAVPMLEKGLTLQPYRTDLLYDLGLSYDMLGRQSEADQLFGVLANLDPAGTYFRPNTH